METQIEFICHDLAEIFDDDLEEINKYMIELNNITKNYYIGKQEFKVLKWITLTINKWDYMSIMWHSGSWKSTLMNIIWMLDIPTSWEYIFWNENIEKISENKRAEIRWKSIWFVFQSYNLIPRMSSLHQVCIPLMYQWIKWSKRNIMAEEALKIVWLWDKLNNMPNELSWWQQQRVSIARAIVNDPEIILADEPTWALDSKTWEEIMKIFSELNKKWKTIVIITHEKNIAEYASKHIKIHDWELY